MWGLTWLLPGFALGIYGALTLSTEVPMSATLWVRLVAMYCVLWTLWGAMSGAGFALALALVERGRSFSQLSFRRFATLGAIGAVTPSAIFVAVAWFQMPFADLLLPITFILLVSAVLGALCAVGTFALARRTSGDVSSAAA